MEKMLMQEYIEDYAKFLCLEENEGTLFYFYRIEIDILQLGEIPEYSRIKQPGYNTNKRKRT